MHVDLTNRTVLVTGASRGIGRAIARQCAESGAVVAAQFFKSREEAESLAAGAPERIHLFRADLADLVSCRRLFASVLEHFGGIDVLINNAGVALPLSLDASLEAWWKGWDLTMHVNVRAAELLSRLAIPHFRDRGGGRIISMASRAAFRGDAPPYMTYAASKAALVALTRSIARGFGRDGIRAFVVAPGFVRTDMAEPFIDAYGEEYALQDLATDRLTEPDDVAPMVVFLAAGMADHATGATIDVNAASYVR